MRQRNPLVFSAESDFNALPSEAQINWLFEAVYICNQTFAHLRRLESDPTDELLQDNARNKEKWHALHKDYKAADWAEAIAAFRNYIASQTPITEFKQRRDPFPFLPCASMPDAKGRSLGGPYDATLIQFLVGQRLCGSEGEAMEYPFARAEMHYLTHLEREGALKIINNAEMEFEEKTAELDLKAAKVAGFDTVEAHVESVTANARAAKETPASIPAAPAGLATPVPGELTETPEQARKRTSELLKPSGKGFA